MAVCSVQLDNMVLSKLLHNILKTVHMTYLLCEYGGLYDWITSLIQDYYILNKRKMCLWDNYPPDTNDTNVQT